MLLSRMIDKLLLVLVVGVTDLHMSLSITIYTGKFNQSDCEAGFGLEGHLIKATKAENPMECFSQCTSQCGCLAYQLVGSRCELLSETKTTAASGSFVAKTGYKYFELKQTFKQKDTGITCNNGCCSQKSCLGGATCTEKCSDVKHKFSCVCKPGYGGKFCEIPPSCDKLPSGSPSGVYTIMNPPNQLKVYCDFTSEPGFVWTLIESFAFADETRRKYFSKSFHIDFPQGEADLNWTDYRMSLSNMRHIETHSTHWRATCMFDSDGLKYDDYLRARKASQSLLQEIPGKCLRFEWISARNISCKNCTGYIMSGPAYHVHGDSTKGTQLSPPCDWDASTGAVLLVLDLSPLLPPDGEEFFGMYEVFNPRHRCSSSDSATTNWWLGKRVLRTALTVPKTTEQLQRQRSRK